MTALRLAISLLLGIVVVLAMLVIGLRLFYGKEAPPESSLEAFEVEYLTPEEAARLLGEDPDRRRLPDMPVAPPSQVAPADPPERR